MLSKCPSHSLKWIALAALSVAASLSAQPRDRGYIVTPNTNAIMLMPELKAAPAPVWLKPGTRILVDRLDGTISINPKRSGAGHGIDQLDIVSVQPDAVAVMTASNIVDALSNTLTNTGAAGVTTTPGDFNDVWITPDVFHKYMNINGDNVSSTRQDYDAAGKTWKASVLQIASHGVVTYYRDIETGVLLHTAADAATLVAHNMAQSTLLEIRDIKSPWTAGHLPRALDGVHQIHIEGAQDTLIPGTSMFRSPLRITLKVTGRGPDFVQLQSTGQMQIGTIPTELSKVDLVNGPAQLTPAAVEPADLAKLHQGQVLDTDPVTHIVTTVSNIGRGDNGKNIVVITSGVPGVGQQVSEVTYDATTGWAIGTMQTHPALHHVTWTKLVSVE